MATIARVPVSWTGLTGLPGVSVFYWNFSTAADLSALNAFFDGIKGLFPSALSWSIPGSGDNIDDATGTLNGSWIATGSGVITATGGAGNFAAGVGARARWNTSGIRNGRRVRGATFLAPMTVGVYDSVGTLSTSALSTIQTEASDLATNGGVVIWSRPTPGGSDGASHAVISASVPDRVTALRSRRF